MTREGAGTGRTGAGSEEEAVGGVVIGTLGLLVAAAVVHLVTVQASRGGLDVNPAVGIRTRLTTSSPAAWVAGHRAALGWVRVGSGVAVAAAVIAAGAAGVAAAVDAGPAVPAVVLVSGHLAYAGAVLLATRAANQAVRRLGR